MLEIKPIEIEVEYVGKPEDKEAVFKTLEELEKAFPEDFDFSEQF